MALGITSHRIRESRYMEKGSTLAQPLRTQPSCNAAKSQGGSHSSPAIHPNVNAVPKQNAVAIPGRG
jgi:hypothetical protein